MPKYWFDHLHLGSPEPLGTAKFYEDNLGAERTWFMQLDDGRVFVDVSLGGVKLRISKPVAQSLVPNASPNGGIDHFGVQTDDLEAAVSQLESQGMKLVKGISAGPLGRYAFFLAPQGVLIELMEKNK